MITSKIGAANDLPNRIDIKPDLYSRFVPFFDQGQDNIGSITSIIQDRTGFIWFGGENGLGRFDGYNFKVYKSDSIEKSIPNNNISSIHLDKFGVLWIGTLSGLAYYDDENDEFETVFGHYLNDDIIVDSIYVREFLPENDSLIWIETRVGQLKAFNPKLNKYKNIITHGYVEQYYYKYHTLVQDGDSCLIIGGRQMGPYLYNKTTQTLRILPVDIDSPDGFKREHDVAFALALNKRFIWIGGLDGLYLYDKQENYFHKYLSGSVYTMIQTNDNKYWLGTGYGALLIDPATGGAQHFSINNNDAGSLGGERIVKIFEDRSGRIWLAHENGISTFQPPKSGVKYYFHIPGIDNTPASSRITSIVAADNDQIWIGTQDEGLDLFDYKTDKFNHYNPSTNQEILSTKIRALVNDPDGNTWVAYWAGKGFGRIDKKTKHIESYTYNPKMQTQDWYNDFEFGSNDQLYVGFWGGPGLSVFDSKKKQFTKILADCFEDAYHTRLISSLFKDKDGILWVGTTQSGIHFRDEKNNYCKSFYTELNENGGFDSKFVYDIIQDHSGSILVSAKGVYMYDSVNQRFNKILLPEPFQDVEFYQMINSKDSAVWMLSSNGLMKFTTKSNRLVDYSMIIDLRFKAGQAAAAFLPNGQLLLGGSNGLALFSPEILGYENVFPKAYLTHFELFNSIFVPSLQNKEKVDLKYNENFFSIHFGTDRWDHTQNYTYYYKMEGFSDDWIPLAPGQRSASFTNVPAGSYIFRMRTGDAFGNMSEQESKLIVDISPAWYTKWWFVLLASSLIIFIIFIFNYLRIKDIQHKLFNIELNQKLLRLQMNPHFIFNSLTSIQNYIYAQETHLASQYLADFARLIRLILENSRYEAISLEKEIETLGLYMSLQSLRFNQNIDFQLTVDPKIDTEITYVPPMLAQPFLENALEHGLKQKQGKGEIKLHYKMHDKMIQIEVKDNGIGLTASKGNKTTDQKIHESLSIKICRERLNLLEKRSGKKIPFSIEEMTVRGNVLGTKVIFSVPLRIFD